MELNLLNGRSFSSLEHLNQTAQAWLANTADVRIHREIGRRPIDAFVEEQPHLLKLPGAAYDTAKVVYRVVDVEGMISYDNNLYSTPWRFIGRMLPVRVTEHELIVYDPASLEVVACHSLVPRPCKGERRIDAAHRPAASTLRRSSGPSASGPAPRADAGLGRGEKGNGEVFPVGARSPKNPARV